MPAISGDQIHYPAWRGPIDNQEVRLGGFAFIAYVPRLMREGECPIPRPEKLPYVVDEERIWVGPQCLVSVCYPGTRSEVMTVRDAIEYMGRSPKNVHVKRMHIVPGKNGSQNATLLYLLVGSREIESSPACVSLREFHASMLYYRRPISVTNVEWVQEGKQIVFDAVVLEPLTRYEYGAWEDPNTDVDGMPTGTEKRTVRFSLGVSSMMVTVNNYGRSGAIKIQSAYRYITDGSAEIGTIDCYPGAQDCMVVERMGVYVQR